MRQVTAREGLCRPLLLAAVALGLLVLTPLAVATPPGSNGRVAFMRKDVKGFWQVWIAGRRLTGAKQLTSGAADSGWAVWSPKGRKLAYTSTRSDPNLKDSTEVWDVYTMNPNGSDVHKLTDSTGFADDPAWSPDGSLIAFESDRGKPTSMQGIYAMSADGRSVRRITVLPPHYEYDLAPRFSPDGKRLVFTRFRGSGQSERAALFTVDLHGSNLRRLTSFAIHAGDADWSPDGTRLVFEAYPNPHAYGDVYVIGADGSHLKNLTRNPVGKAGSADPVWSPDGSKILFLDNRIVQGSARTGLATIEPDGSARSFVSGDNIESHQPDWESTH
jgi:Tol biopolymer transport system component